MRRPLAHQNAGAGNAATGAEALSARNPTCVIVGGRHGSVPPPPALALPYALGGAGLGAVGIVFRDFALQWQPVPAQIPGREALAVACGLILALGCLALLSPRLRGFAAFAAAAFDTVWVLVLLVPKAVAAPTNLVAWLGVAEIMSLACGGAMLLGVAFGLPTVAKLARRGFGLCALVFGASHFVYVDFTAKMVPGFLPAPLFWAYATGVAHALAALALLTGVRARLAATLLATMCFGFVLLVHLPRVAGDPTSHAEWTALFISMSIAGAAWTLRASDMVETLPRRS